MKGKPTNEVATTTEMNMTCAKLTGCYYKATRLFRMLEHANDRGTGGKQFEELERHFAERMSLVELRKEAEKGKLYK